MPMCTYSSNLTAAKLGEVVAERRHDPEWARRSSPGMRSSATGAGSIEQPGAARSARRRRHGARCRSRRPEARGEAVAPGAGRPRRSGARRRSATRARRDTGRESDRRRAALRLALRAKEPLVGRVHDHPWFGRHPPRERSGCRRLPSSPDHRVRHAALPAPPAEAGRLPPEAARSPNFVANSPGTVVDIEMTGAPRRFGRRAARVISPAWCGPSTRSKAPRRRARSRAGGRVRRMSRTP